MDLCILPRDGERLVHRHRPTGPDPFLKTSAPSRAHRVVGVECICTWSWLAARWAREGMPCVLGQALSLKAIHGGKATNDPSAAHKIAVGLRGGLLPQASGDPAGMRATRDLLRRRMPRMRQRAELLAHVQNTNRQYHVPESGQKIAYHATRDGGAARFPAPAVPQSRAVALALIESSARLLTDLALSSGQTARPQDAHPLSRLQTGPGSGTIVSRVLLSAIPQIDRVPRVQAFGSSCRLVTGAKESAGTRSGTSGQKIGHASLPWAWAEAAGLGLRTKAQGQPCRARWEKTHGQGTALTLLAPKVARAVSYMVRRGTGFAMAPLLQGSGSRAGEPAASLDTDGISLQTVLGKTVTPCVLARDAGHRLASLIPRGCLATRSGAFI